MSTKAPWKLLVALGLAAVVLAILFELLASKPAVETPPRQATAPTPSPAPAPPAPAAAPSPAATPPHSLDKFLLANPEEDSTSQPPPQYPVKFEELRAKLPDNLYWELDAPTTDPAVLQKRAEAKRKWNEVFGKIQSGDATEEEIHRYYDFRQKRSEDAIAMANQIIADYGDKLPDTDRGLIDLSIRMHQDRLKEMPRQTEEALARKALQDQRREEWIRNGRKP